jgi:hypothetical protein
MIFHSHPHTQYSAVAILAFIFLFLFGCSPVDTDLKSGFRGIAWKSAIEDTEGMTVIEGDGGRFVWFARDSEELTFSSLPVDAIKYEFIDNAFSRVEIQYSGYPTFSEMIKLLETTWGPADFEKRQNNQLIWKVDDVLAKLNYYRMPDSGTLKFTLKR